MTAIVRRIFHYLDYKTFVPLYKSLVRTQLDFASSMPGHCNRMRHIEMVERVQRRVTNFIMSTFLEYQILRQNKPKGIII